MLARDVRKLRPASNDIAAGHRGPEVLALHVDAVARAVYRCFITAEDISEAPAVVDLVHLEPVTDGVDTGVVQDHPAVAFHVDPCGRRRGDHAGAVKGVADAGAAGGSFLDIDILGSCVRVIVAGYDVVVASVRLAVGVLAPVLVSGADVYSFTEELHVEAGIADDIVAYHVVAAEGPDVNGLIAGAVDVKTVNEIVRGGIKDDTFLPAFHAEALDVPPRGLDEIERVARVGARALEHRAPAAADGDRRGAGAGSGGDELALVDARCQHDR